MPAGQWGMAEPCLETQLPASCCPLNGGLVWTLEAETPRLGIEQLMEPPLLALLTGGFPGKSSQCRWRERASCPLLSGHWLPLHTRDVWGV